MAKPVILYVGAAEGFASLVEVLDGRGEARHIEAEPATLAMALREADALLDASMKVPIDDGMAAAADRLKIISCATTGSDHIARLELERRNVPIRTLREDRELLRTLTPAAELSWALLLACARRLPAAAAHTRAGDWAREEFPGLMLNGRTLGLIGCGRLGQWMARYGAAFGMRVLGHDPHVAPWPDGIEPVDLGAELLAKAKPGLILINTSRGAIVDEAALLAGLQDGRIGAAGLDVLDGEPDIGSHLLIVHAKNNDNLIITPHIGGFSPDAVRRVCRRAAEKIVAHLEL
jgi:D-3-phosphoglycerate dehydrogenase